MKDKQGHCFWFIAAGPGCGKSRCLDEFPSVLEIAASQINESDELQARLKEMCIFKLSFESGTRYRGGLPDRALIPARMAYQLQESSLSWMTFADTAAAQDMTFEALFEHLRQIRGLAMTRDLTILLLIDGLQESGSALEGLVSAICDLTNKSVPFVMIACAATIQTTIREFLRTSGQYYVSLTPPPISDPLEITSEYEKLENYSSRIMAKIMIQDMGGHGRALEILLETLKAKNLDFVLPSTIMHEVSMKLRHAYTGWNPLPSGQEVGLLTSIIGQSKLSLNDVIPGTSVTVDRILQSGFFRYDYLQETLSVAYIWILLMRDRIRLRELTSVISFDHDEIRKKIEEGSSSVLSPAAFEEFCCNFRAVRSRCYEDKCLVEWSRFHSGAIFSKGCNIDFENRHLSLSRAAAQFGTASSYIGVIKLQNGSDSNRDSLLDTVILNCPGAPSGDSMVVLKLCDGKICTEAHQSKRLDASSLNTDAVLKERKKAADGTDFFVLFCSGNVTGALDQLPERTAVIDANCFEQYFGPFAGRAFIYKHVGPLDVNAASVFQLQQCVGIARVTAKQIIETRNERQFSDADDFKSRVRYFSDAIMEQFIFDRR